jgi:hypothetical protein
MTMKRLSSLLLLFLLSISARADDPAKLVEQLGDASYEKRESASAELTKLKEKAKLSLEAGLKSKDKETRQRCKQILEVIAKSMRQERFERFRKDPTSEPDFHFWKEFSELYGKEYHPHFCKMVEERLELLEKLVVNPKAGIDFIYNESVKFSVMQMQQIDGVVSPSMDSREYAFLLFILSSNIRQAKALIDQNQGIDKFQKAINFPINAYDKSHYKDEFFCQFMKASVEKIVARSQSILNSSDLSLLMKPVLICCNISGSKIYESIFKDVLSDKKMSRDVVIIGLSYFGELKDAKHVELLMPFLASDTPIFSREIIKLLGFMVEHRDVALRSLILMRNLNPHQFGFCENNSVNMDHISFYGFTKDEDRTRAFSAYADYVYR